MDELAVELEQVCFSYDGTQQQVLKDVSIKIKKGEFITLIGPNGAGKTTLVRTIIGLNQPTWGRVVVHGEDLSNLTVAQISRKVGFLFQNPDHQLFEDTVYKEIEIGLINHGVQSKRIGAIVRENIEFCGLTGLEERAPEELSIGEKKRVALAATLALGTDILIFDEPTTGQTWSNLKTLMPVIDKLNNQGTTVVMITHDIDLVVQYSSRIIVLKDGNIVFDGDRDGLFTDEKLLIDAHLAKPPVLALSGLLSKTDDIIPCFESEELIDQITRKLSCQT
jgi:energy-coupling factor transporter ATP-binding protein EcfA2